MAKDFYGILGVSKSASEAEIKQAYRKLSKELHPDKHKGDKTKEAKFKEVNEAYEVLSDPKKKQNYDSFGSENGSPFGGGGGGGGGFGGFDPSQFSGSDFSDIFESFFSGAGGGGGRRRAPDTRGRNVEAEIGITLHEAVTGTDRSVTMKVLILCSDCGGSGNLHGSKLVNCHECGGTGAVQKTVRSLFGTMQQNVVCTVCAGSGKVPEHPCKKCSGEGRVTDKRTVSVHIPAGIDDGQSLRIKGEGEAGKRGSESGDLLVRVRVAPDARFEREGEDIRSRLIVSVADATLGEEVTCETVQGPVSIHVPAGTQPGQVLRVKGKGMPVVNTSRHGDHYAIIEVAVPTKLSREERRLFEELKKLRT